MAPLSSTALESSGEIWTSWSMVWVRTWWWSGGGVSVDDRWDCGEGDDRLLCEVGDGVGVWLYGLWRRGGSGPYWGSASHWL
jgi:hypothetical protein